MKTIHHMKANEGEHLQLGTDVVTIKASGNDTDGSMLVVDVRVPAGGGPPVVHRNASSKVFHLLEGEFAFTTVDADNRLHILRAETGDTVAIPAGVWHNIKNTGSTTGRYIGMHSPPQMEYFLRELGQPINDPLRPVPPTQSPSAEQQQKWMSVIQQHMEVLPIDQFVQEK